MKLQHNTTECFIIFVVFAQLTTDKLVLVKKKQPESVVVMHKKCLAKVLKRYLQSVKSHITAYGGERNPCFVKRVDV